MTAHFQGACVAAVHTPSTDLDVFSPALCDCWLIAFLVHIVDVTNAVATNVFSLQMGHYSCLVYFSVATTCYSKLKLHALLLQT